MRKVLLIEDNPTKMRAIQTVITQSFVAEVSTASSISFAYSTLPLRTWDLVILDMTFQASQGTGREISKEALAGIEVLQYVQRMGGGAPVIVATQHTTFASKEFPEVNSLRELDVILKDAFPEVYREIVLIDLASEKWKREIRRAIRRVWGGIGKVTNSYR